jgi:hypothetical protein
LDLPALQTAIAHRDIWTGATVIEKETVTETEDIVKMNDVEISIVETVVGMGKMVGFSKLSSKSLLTLAPQIS